MGAHHANLIPYRDYTRRLLTYFTKVELHHIPREENQMADALATLSSMFQVNHWNHVPVIKVQRLDRPSHVFAIGDVIIQAYADVVDTNPGIMISSSFCKTVNTRQVLPTKTRRPCEDWLVSSC